MSDKLIQSVPAIEIGSSNPAERGRGSDQEGRHRPGPVMDCNEDSARDSAEYIAVLASQLQRIAQTNGQDFLAYLIDMVVEEAWRIAGPDADHRDKNTNGVGGGRD
jgi:hypothetical protein